MQTWASDQIPDYCQTSFIESKAVNKTTTDTVVKRIPRDRRLINIVDDQSFKSNSCEYYCESPSYWRVRTKTHQRHKVNFWGVFLIKNRLNSMNHDESWLIHRELWWIRLIVWTFWQIKISFFFLSNYMHSVTIDVRLQSRSENTGESQFSVTTVTGHPIVCLVCFQVNMMTTHFSHLAVVSSVHFANRPLMSNLYLKGLLKTITS